jgi:Arc/MetJ family transcription regulator
MRTTLNVDDDVFRELMAITRAKTKTEAVRVALTEYVRLKRKTNLLALRGRLEIADDWRELRAREVERDGEGE